MTPKEKAEELVDKMERPMDGVSIFRLASKQLALIAVDEIIQATKVQMYEEIEVIKRIEGHFILDSYWVEVKREINKL
jgi:hypothetical protein